MTSRATTGAWLPALLCQFAALMIRGVDTAPSRVGALDGSAQGGKDRLPQRLGNGLQCLMEGRFPMGLLDDRGNVT